METLVLPGSFLPLEEYMQLQANLCKRISLGRNGSFPDITGNLMILQGKFGIVAIDEIVQTNIKGIHGVIIPIVVPCIEGNIRHEFGRFNQVSQLGVNG